MCIRYHGNVSTEPLPSNNREIFPSRCLATIGLYKDTDTHRQQRDLISLVLFFQNKEFRLKSEILHDQYDLSVSLTVFGTAKQKQTMVRYECI
jgi:hypothetical protein